MSGPADIWTVGHSNHPLERFLALLQSTGVTAIADVRSAPYSRRFKYFNREPLRTALSSVGVAYVWLGDALGGKHAGGATPPAEAVTQALDRLADGAERYRVALMCAEADPAQCHRARLVAPLLVARGHAVRHLRADGTLEEHDSVQVRIAGRDRTDPRQDSLL
jgi:uncharacterized protein (DUF488 family)